MQWIWARGGVGMWQRHVGLVNVVIPAPPRLLPGKALH
jgi:hypothetical protein